MAIMNNGAGIIFVNDDPNVDITPNVGEDAEIAWRPTSNELWYWDRGASEWKKIIDSGSFTVTDGSNPQTIDNGDTLNFSDGNDVLFDTSTDDTVTASIILNAAGTNILTSSASGLLANIINADGISGEGTSGSPLNINLDGTTVGNAAVITSGQGLYVPNEVVSNSGPLSGAAPAGAEWGVDVTNGVVYYVSAGNWTQLPTDYSFSITDGTTSQTIANGNSITFSDGDDIDFTVSATDTVSATVKLDGNAGNTTTSSSSGLLTLINSGDSLSGAGTSGSPLGVNLDGTTGGNALTLTAGEGLYAPNEVVTGTTALTGAAPAGAEWGVNTSSGIIYYVNNLGNWAPVPVTYSFSITDGDTTETVVGSDVLTFADSPTINFTVAATDQVTAGIKLSQTAGNDLTSDGTGVFLDVSALESAIAFTTDSTSTGVSLSGTNNHTIDIKLLSADAGNALSTGSDGGLYFKHLAATAYANDTSAGVGGVAIGEFYQLSGTNTYGLPEGIMKVRKN